ncbi:MAG: rod shape-determining protein [bacterium]|nr:rod shape-determining protein [bacterium]MDZ4285255.1 rod shape-determining protein [Patescibacteria group bacterium]
MFHSYLEHTSRFLSNDIGIDLGTANTLVYLRGRGIILNEPSVVALNQKTGRVVAVGNDARAMLGRTPPHIAVVKPLVDGVISDFEVAEELVGYLISRAQQNSRKPLGPRVVVGVPSGITNVETRAVRDAARNAGARSVHIIEEPMAAALGIRLPVREPVGSMIVDIGGGTTDIAVISLGGIVAARNIRVAGEKLNADIIGYVRDEFKMLVGEKTAEDIKISIGTLREEEHERTESPVRGRDLMTGLPREMMMTASDVREAIAQSIETIIEATKEVLETTPPEVLADVMRRGMYLCGGGALLRGLPELFEEWLKIPVHVVDDPLTAVARGTGVVLEDIAAHEDMLVAGDDALPPQ